MFWGKETANQEKKPTLSKRETFPCHQTLVGGGQPSSGPCSRLTPALPGAIQPPEVFAETNNWTRRYVGRCRPPRSQTLRTSLQAPKSETASPSAASCAIPIRTSQRPFHHLLQLSGPQFSASKTRLCTVPSAHASFSARPPTSLPDPAPIPQPPDEAPLPRATMFPSHAASATLSQ